MTDPSYIRTVNLIGIEKHPTLGLITRCTGMKPYKGRFPDAIIECRINGAKSVLAFFVFLLRTTPLILVLLIPSIRLKIFRRLGMVLYKLLMPMWVTLPDSDYSRPVRELNRAIDVVIKQYGNWQLRMVLNFKYTLLCILEFDDAYRFIFQDLIGGALNKYALRKNPRKELKHLVDIGISRTHWEGVKVKFNNIRFLLNFIPKGILNKIVEVLLEIDKDKIGLDEDDMDWAVDKPYDFGGVPYKGREYSLQRGQNNATMNNDLSPQELESFNKELGELCQKYGATLQILNNPQLLVKKAEKAQPNEPQNGTVDTKVSGN